MYVRSQLVVVYAPQGTCVPQQDPVLVNTRRRFESDNPRPNIYT